MRITKSSVPKMAVMLLVFVVIFSQFSPLTTSINVFNYTLCKAESFSSTDSFVCTCTDLYCDGFSKEEINLPKDSFAVYTSSKDAARFALGISSFSNHSIVGEDTVVLTVNTSETFQEIIGFGGAFTDAATINIKNLSETLQDHLINSYYSPTGIEYNIGRIPMASCDFSTRIYTYDDTPNDFALKNFKLASEDLDYKIPVIKAALGRSKRDIQLFGSPWSAPGWMKTSNSTIGGVLRGSAGDKYHETWASYFVKFLDSYKENGVNLWGITVENEPFAGYIPFYKFQCMGFTGSSERDFIKKDLGPALVKAGYSDVKVIILDDNRLTIPKFPETILEDSDASKYVAGVGVHWYEDVFIPALVLTELHNKFPNYFILATEACNGAENVLEKRGPSLGNWERGEKYSQSIIDDFQNWVGGWTDWNLALNMEGGPNWVKNFVDSPIIVNQESKVFYKQPMFYHLGHFSKFIVPSSFRIDITSETSNELQYVAFLLPDHSKVAVLLNPSSKDYTVSIKIGNKSYINAEIKSSSIQTYIWM